MKSRTQWILALVVAAAAIAAVAVVIKRQGAPVPVRLAGRVVDAAGAPVAEARVILEVAPSDTEEETAVERVETLTDAKGEFAIDYQGHWRHASYSLEAQKPGYQILTAGSAETLKSPVILKMAPAPR